MKLGNTSIIRDLEKSGLELIQYHKTIVFRADHNIGLITLNSGGWHTVTTKQRMNVGLKQYGYYLYQDDYNWYIKDKQGNIIDYKDNMQLALNK